MQQWRRRLCCSPKWLNVTQGQRPAFRIGNGCRRSLPGPETCCIGSEYHNGEDNRITVTHRHQNKCDKCGGNKNMNAEVAEKIEAVLEVAQ